MSYKDKNNLPDFLSSDCELGNMIVNFDWSSTPLGPIQHWPQSLKTSVNLMLNIKNPIWISWGPEKILLYNDACIQILGTDKHEWALGKPAPSVWQDAWNLYSKSVKEAYNGNYPTKDADATVLSSPVFDESGNVAGVFCQHEQTITERCIESNPLFYKKLEESEAKFRSLVDRAPIGVVILKGDALIYDIANDAYLAIFKKQKDDVLGKRLTDILPQLKNSDVEKGLIEVIATGENQKYINRPVPFTDNNGKKFIRYFNSTHLPFIENNKVTGVISVVSEVTEQYLSQKTREQNEKDLIQILETMPHITFRTNPNGMVTYYNDRYFEYTGLKPEQAINEGWKSVIHPDMLDEVTAIWTESIRSGKDFDIVFLIRRATDGAYRWHNSRGVALRNEQGEITEWIGTLTDIHERKVFEEELEAMVSDRTQKLNNFNLLLAQKNMELERTNKELESFNYVASHDLQEPLRKIQTFINMIKEWSMEGEMAQNYLDKIFNSAERMSRLIQDVLVYSRLSADDKFVTTDLNCILSNALIDYDLAIFEKKATIATTTLPVITAIPLQMYQLFTNLISNSLKYSNEALTIKISGTIITEETDGIHREYAEIVFSDNGIGFEPQYSKQIFKLFQRLHGKTEYSGTGVGLSICKKIIEQHKGSIKAESQPGMGATFTIKLPV